MKDKGKKNIYFSIKSMITKNWIKSFIILFFLSLAYQVVAYPIDGYLLTGIRRLLYLQLVEDGDLKGKKLIPGAKKSINDIKINLHGTPNYSSLNQLSEVDPVLQKEINKLFPHLDQKYSIALLDITPGKPIRYAERKPNNQYQPGSVGKLAVITGLFCQLENIYPYDFQNRIELLKTKMVKAGQWAIRDDHTVPVYDVENSKRTKRQVKTSDVFSLYEWVDHMMSVSNNGAAAVVWREVILMSVFGENYPNLTFEEAEKYFKSTKKSELSEIAISVVNDPLRSIGIGHDEFRLGTMFTRGATSYIPRKGGSTGTTIGLMKWMVALERGDINDAASSLEIKRLMYMTDRRIRYASSPALTSAGVYFKSGSLYKCDRSTAPDCGKYKGNVYNYMNSVAIIEHPDSTTYLVALMSNVLNKNSAYDHLALASSIDKVVRKED